MASDKFVLARPIYVDTNSDSFAVDATGTPAALNLTNGTYACMANMLERLKDLLVAHHASFTVTVNSSFKVVIENLATTFDWLWTDAAIRNRLGYDGSEDITAVNTLTATYTPLYCWLPERIRSDRNAWVLDQKKLWNGVEVGSGATPGLKTGDEIWRTSIEMRFEPDENLLRSHATTAFERDRCLETFIYGGGTNVLTGCREAWPGDSGEPSPAGFYFWKDYTDLQTEQTMDEGSAEDFKLASGASEYAFCQFDSSFYAEFRNALDVGTDFYNTDLQIHTVSTAPIGDGDWVTLP